MLTLTFLGVNSAFTKRGFQSNALVEAWTSGPDQQAAPDDTLLIDFGTMGPSAIYQLKNRPEFGYLDCEGSINYSAIRRIFITHRHADHIGGLEEVAILCRYRSGDRGGAAGFKPQLISSIDVLVDLWDHSLKGGLGAQRGRHALLQDYFFILTLRPCDQGGPDQFCMLDRYAFIPFPTDHIQIRRPFDWPSFGLLIVDKQSGERVVYSGDTRFDPDGMGEAMTAAKLIFHDVQLEDEAQPVHALLAELRTLPEATRKKTLLYHFGDTWDCGAYQDVGRAFRGFAKPQHRYTLFD